MSKISIISKLSRSVVSVPFPFLGATYAKKYNFEIILESYWDSEN